MAQYHFAATLVCRSKGQSAVAAAAYRAGILLEDERLGKTFDYTRRRGVLHTEILTAANTPYWMRDRGQLWNAVEKVEKRKDSQLARSIDIALPHELTFDRNLELVRDFVRAVFVSRGMIADIAIHAPGRKGDIRNVHVHILLTTRELAGPGFGPKARNWNGKQELQYWREAWAAHANRILEREGFAERIDHRSLSDQGIDREPTTHIGPAAREMEQRGVPSDRVQKNRDITAANDNMALLKSELAESEKLLAELKRQLAAERMEQIQKTVRAVNAAYQKAERPQAPAPERPPEPEPPAKPPELPASAPRRRLSRKRQPAPERMKQIQKTVRAADAFWNKAEGRWPPTPEPPEPEPPAPAQPLQPQGQPPYPENSPPPVSAGGKAVSMPDDFSEAQKLAAEQEAARQKQAQNDEQARQQQAAADENKRIEAAQQQETQRQAQAKQDEDNRHQQLRDAENKRVDDLARQHADRLEAQAEQMRQAQLRLDARKEEQARFDAHRAALEKIASDDRRREESERQARLEARAKEGPIRDAGERYAQALGQHYDFGNPYASLAKAAMAEYAAFRKDREALDQQIARTTDPIERQALDLRKRIEGAEYIFMTSERIAQQSVVITGRRDSDEAVKFRKRATDYRIQSQDLRQQLRELRQGRAPEPERERERSEPQPAGVRRPGTGGPNRYDEIIKKVDDAAKAQEREAERDPQRQTQQEKERELQRKRDRER
jgi:hypothetical protein